MRLRRSPILVAVLLLGAAAAEKKIDPFQAIEEARALTAEGKFEDALQKYLWFHNNALKLDPGYYGVRLTALREWAALGEKYPPARDKLTAIRNANAQKLADGRGDYALFHDVVAIDKALNQDDATIALFRTLHEKQPKFASECILPVWEVLVDLKEYQLCGAYVQNPSVNFGRARADFEKLKKMWGSGPDPETIKKVSIDIFVRKMQQLVEVFVALDRRADAEDVVKQALALQDDERLKTAIADAEKRVKL